MSGDEVKTRDDSATTHEIKKPRANRPALGTVVSGTGAPSHIDGTRRSDKPQTAELTEAGDKGKVDVEG